MSDFLNMLFAYQINIGDVICFLPIKLILEML